MTCSSGYQALFSVCQNASYIHDTSLHLCCDQLSTSFSTIPDCYCQFTHEGLIMNGTAFYSDAVNLCGLSVPPSITACLLNTNGKPSSQASLAYKLLCILLPSIVVFFIHLLLTIHHHTCIHIFMETISYMNMPT